MGIPCSKFSKKKNKKYAKKNGEKKKDGLNEGRPQVEKNATEENKNRISGKETKSSEQKSRKGRRGKKGRHKRNSYESSDSWSSSSSSSSSASGGGKTTTSKKKMIDKNGSVTYISNKTKIGNNNISFKAGRNINMYHQNTTIQQKPDVKRELFKEEYTEGTAELQERTLDSLFKDQRPTLGQFVDLNGRNNVQSVRDTGVLYGCAEWVGQINFPDGTGTCFRVGTKYVMTAFHIVKTIREKFREFHSVRESDQLEEHQQLSALSDRRVFVDFGFLLEKQQPADRKKFHFKPIKTYDDIPFCDEESDVIMLELLVEPNQVLPLQFTYFGIPKLDKPFHLITHSRGNPKEIDKVTNIVDINNPKTHEDIMFLREESRKFIEERGLSIDTYPCETPPHDMLDNRSRLLFHCASSKGASGSPGVQITASGHVVVVTMLIHGYPDWRYDDKSKSIRCNWQEAYTIEQGINFASVFSKMREQNRTLCDEIFPPEDQRTGITNFTIHAVQPEENQNQVN